MIVLFIIGFVSLVFFIDSIVRYGYLKKTTFFKFVSLLCAIALFNFFIKESFVDVNLQAQFDKEMEYIQSNCSKKVTLPKTFVVQFGKTGDAIGYCQHYLNGFRIVINSWYWNVYLDDLGKHQLLIHEMMHCVFNLGHVEDNPRHFMAPEYDYIKANDLDLQVKSVLKTVCAN